MQTRRFDFLSTAALLAGLLLLPLPSLAKSEIFKLTDPRGDDHGDGNLEYPLNEELNPGDLDLISLTAKAEKEGTLFEATFARQIRQPGRVAIDDLGTQLDTIARFGFYTLNLDIYIDMDRQPGSGGIHTMPGRHAEVAPEFAWERAIILTPRPHEARGALKRMLMKELTEDAKEGSAEEEAEIAALRAQVPGDVEERIFFPTQVRVRGNKISFFVPATFLNGTAKDTWGYVVAVSGANVLQSFDLSRVLGRTGEKEKSLMILPVSPGRWQDRFGGGRESAPNQPPLIDIIVPENRKQESVLSSFDRRKPVVLPGVVPNAR